MKNRLFASMAMFFVAAAMLSSCCYDRTNCDPCSPPSRCKPICVPAPKACCPVPAQYSAPKNFCPEPGSY